MLSIVERLEERLKRIRDLAVSEMHRQAEAIIGKAKQEEVSEPEVEESTEVVALEAEDKKDETPPEPVATKPRQIAHRGKNGKISKSKLIREFFEKHPEASNKELIEFYKKKHNIEIKPALVSTVKINMGVPKSKRRGRPAKAVGHVRAKEVASAKAAVSKKGMPMPACVTKVVAKHKDGLRIDKILEGVKKYYTYGGKQEDDGLKNVIYQALYALSKKKPHRGWKGEIPVILHDEESCTWRLNPKAERKTA